MRRIGRRSLRGESTSLQYSSCSVCVIGTDALISCRVGIHVSQAGFDASDGIDLISLREGLRIGHRKVQHM